MRFVRFKLNDQIQFGAIENESIRVWSDAPWLGGCAESSVVPMKDVQLLAPCQPGKVVGVAINFPGATGHESDFKEPLVFLKPGTSVISPDETIVSPFQDAQVWGESELAVVIGKKLTRASRQDALEGLFGYTIGNDVSADNIRGWDHHLARSKAADTFCVLGPWIDTDFNPHGKSIRAYHNQELLREGIADNRLWTEPELLVWLSSWMTLEPGDVILTGAPTRVRDRMYLHSGDSFTCTIEGLGELTNTFQCTL